MASEVDLHPSVTRAIQEIDAGFFSSDEFLSHANLNEIERYVTRWKDAIDGIRAAIRELDNG